MTICLMTWSSPLAETSILLLYSIVRNDRILYSNANFWTQLIQHQNLDALVSTPLFQHHFLKRFSTPINSVSWTPIFHCHYSTLYCPHSVYVCTAFQRRKFTMDSVIRRQFFVVHPLEHSQYTSKRFHIPESFHEICWFSRCFFVMIRQSSEHNRRRW